MNLAFDAVIAADPETRLGLFTATAQGLGTTPRNVEKDFWVSWTLDALFNGRPDGAPRLLFKGGTSLSKGYGLISRFSEDIDVTVFRDDLGAPAEVTALEAMSGNARKATLERIAAAGADYIQGPLSQGLWTAITQMAARTDLEVVDFHLAVAVDDPQTLLLRYPSVTPPDAYVLDQVKIESGAKSALDPNAVRTIRPYVDDYAPDLDLSVAGVTVVDPERTFWDKVVIVHGLRRWYERRGVLRGEGNRISRHYYDLYRLLETEVGARALADRALGADAVAHARMFFNRPDYDLATAQPPTFAVAPTPAMTEPLRTDYRLMAPMLFGPAPAFETVLAAVADLERQLNAPA